MALNPQSDPSSDESNADENPLLEGSAEGELCGICFTCELGEEACVRLGCGHVFHANCVDMLIGHKYTTLRISFGYLDCPACKQEISIPTESSFHLPYFRAWAWTVSG